MNGLHKFRIPHMLKKIPTIFLARFSGAINSKNDGNFCELAKRSRVIRNEAQSVLLEYFHSTRGLQFLDAENMSKNSPEFIYALTNRLAVNDDTIGHALTRFLRYHPINEFEPFFESIGLKPSEYTCYLPRNLMFLNEDPLLMNNYHVLCDYGIPQNNVGKIYKEATEIFHYENGFLISKLQFFKKLNLKHTLVIKIIASSPGLLLGKMIKELVLFLGILKRIGIQFDWLEKHISVNDLYNWDHMIELMSLLSELGLSHDIQREMFLKHPALLLELSGNATFSLINLFLKFGFTLDDMKNAFLHFPVISVSKFATNLRNCYKFLDELGLNVLEVGSIVRSHPTILGSCKMKTVHSLLSMLTCRKERVREIVKKDPQVLKTWAYYVRVQPIQEEKRSLRVKAVKTGFLSSLGIKEKSEEMETILKKLRGNGYELEERFDCLVKMGLNREEAIQCVKISPQILNQSKELIEMKMNIFVNELGYNVSDIMTHPRLISSSVEKMKLRLLMFKWLKEERMVDNNLALVVFTVWSKL